jgi:hypothetical protein
MLVRLYLAIMLAALGGVVLLNLHEYVVGLALIVAGAVVLTFERKR